MDRFSDYHSSGDDGMKRRRQESSSPTRRVQIEAKIFAVDHNSVRNWKKQEAKLHVIKDWSPSGNLRKGFKEEDVQ
uniref:Uncharacterized protein n=1 Tax=Ditylenchus dipsaci TaxID=166011 RepID=A0A915DIE4_9BILA